MKIQALVILAFSFAVISCNDQNTKKDSNEVTAGDVNNPATATGTTPPTGDVPVLSFQEETHDFGKIKAGEIVSHSFRFTNTGTAALIISNATATCGCTVGEYPRQPVKPGESDIIKVTFDSTNKSGRNEKVVTITGNTNPAETHIKIVADVEPAKEGATPPAH